MQIAINCCSTLHAKRTGIGRSTINLLEYIRQIDPDTKYLLYFRKKWIDMRRKIPCIKGENFTIKADYWKRGPKATLGPIDLYHSPFPDFLDLGGVPIVVTVHDLIYKTYPQGHTEDTVT